MNSACGLYRHIVYSMYFQTFASPSSLVVKSKPAVCGHHAIELTSCEWARCSDRSSSNVGWFWSDPSISLKIRIISSPQAVASKPRPHGKYFENSISQRFPFVEKLKIYLSICTSWCHKWLWCDNRTAHKHTSKRSYRQVLQSPLHCPVHMLAKYERFDHRCTKPIAYHSHRTKYSTRLTCGRSMCPSTTNRYRPDPQRTS